MSECRPNGDVLGRHRVVEPDGALPQAANKLDNSLPIALARPDPNCTIARPNWVSLALSLIERFI